MSFVDLLFHFTEWLRTTPLVEISLWLSDTWLSNVIVTNFWVIPIVQTIHISCLGLAFGAILMMNLRVTNLVGTHRSIAATARRFNGWVGWSFLGLLVSGSLLTVGEPVRELINPIFWIKMGLIVIGIVLVMWFHRSIARNGASWDAGNGAPATVRIGAWAIIVLWFFIIAGGRWIAYAPV